MFVLIQSATSRYIQRIRKTRKQTFISVTRHPSQAQTFETEHAASNCLSFQLKHEGWVAKKLMC